MMGIARWFIFACKLTTPIKPSPLLTLTSALSSSADGSNVEQRKSDTKLRKVSKQTELINQLA